MNRISKRVGRLVRGLAAVAVGAGFLVPAFAQGPQVALVQDGPKPDLVVLHTGDVIGYLKPCG